MRTAIVLFLIFSLLFQKCIPFQEHRLDPDKFESHLFLMFKVALTPFNYNFIPTGQVMFSPPPGHYNSPLKVSIYGYYSQYSSLHYTLDGSNPTLNSPLYTEPIPILKLAGKTIKVIITDPQYGNSDVFTANGYYSISPRKTQQYSCYDGSGNTISCSGTSQDGEFQRGSFDTYGPTPGSEVIQNTYTELYWTACSYGQGNYPCSGSHTDANRASATNLCSSLNLDGKTWRLPNLYEMLSMIYFGLSYTPLITTSWFPNPPTSSHWTSTPVPGNPSLGWQVNLINGVSMSQDINTGYPFRCVSGEEYIPLNIFQDLGNGSVKDQVTGLIWQKCSNGQLLPSCTGTATTVNWNSAISSCSSLNSSNFAGRNDWRLPNMHELLSIYRVDQVPYTYNPAFPNTPSGGHWTSTTKASLNPTEAWTVQFHDGVLTGASKTLNRAVRCVAGP